MREQNYDFKCHTGNLKHKPICTTEVSIMMKQGKFSRWSVVLLFIGLAVMTVRGNTVTVVSSADTQLDRNSPDDNTGGAIDTPVSGGLGANSGQDVRRVLVKFDLTGKIPAQAIVTSATVAVAVTKSPPAAGSTFDLRRLFQDWNETDTSWNSRLAGISWSTPGATGANDSSGSASSSTSINGVGAYLFPSSTGLVADVQAWVNNPGTNFGWLLISKTEASETARHFASREYFDPASQPTLTINFTVPAPPAVPPTIAGTSPAGGVFGFSFNAESNRTYGVEFRGSLTTDTWATLTNIPAQPTATNIAVSDPLTLSNRFYRVRTP
ncbi:MAG: hypothetical protein JWR19_383 [Pedosphaera sp.]|nr:hypothetical protein [Pedosphaera sp.]